MTIKKIELLGSPDINYLIIWRDNDEGIIHNFDSRYMSIDTYDLLRAKIKQYVCSDFFKATKRNANIFNDAMREFNNGHMVTVYIDSRMIRIRTKTKDHFIGYREPREEKFYEEIINAIPTDLN